MPQIVIIGAGPAGLCAAVSAKETEPGTSVLLLEKKDRVGKKILATGNGRCNLSNKDLSLAHYHGSATALAETVFAEYSPEAVEAFWKRLGIMYREEEEGKLYPYSLQASSVLDALRFEADRLGIKVQTDTSVKSISVKGKGFVLAANGPDGPVKYTADRVILAVGGAASPKFGSEGDGNKLGKALGLATVPFRPALCRLLVKANELKGLGGYKADARITLLDAQMKEAESKFGEVLFTAEGLSGPPVLRISRSAGELLENDGKAYVKLDFFPEFSAGELFVILQKRFAELSYRTAADALNGLVHKKLIVPLLKRADIAQTASARTLTKKQISALAAELKDWEYELSGLDGFEEAQVSVGGLSAENFNGSLEARKVPGFFACGEAVDLDGDCGGYNLQWAVASGLYAGREGARTVTK